MQVDPLKKLLLLVLIIIILHKIQMILSVYLVCCADADSQGALGKVILSTDTTDINRMFISPFLIQHASR